MLLQRSIFIMLCALVSACGFTPVYQQGGVRDALRSVSIVPQQTREHQMLRTALEDSLAPQGKLGADYTLNVQLAITTQPLSLDADGTTRRVRVLGTAIATLTDITSGKAVMRDQMQQFSSYNIADDADYSTYVSSQDVSRQMVEALAEDIRLRLMQHFMGRVAEEV